MVEMVTLRERFRVVAPDARNAHIVVDLRLGSSEVHFIVDSGASCSVLDARLAEPYRQGGDEPMDAMGLGGMLEGIEQLVVGDLWFGGHCLPELPMVGADLESFRQLYAEHLGESVDGLLGCDLLQRYRATLSFARRWLTLRVPIGA